MSRTQRFWCVVAALVAGALTTFWAVSIQRLLDSVFETGAYSSPGRRLTVENGAVFAIVSTLCYLLFSRVFTAIRNRIP